MSRSPLPQGEGAGEKKSREASRAAGRRCVHTRGDSSPVVSALRARPRVVPRVSSPLRDPACRDALALLLAARKRAQKWAAERPTSSESMRLRCAALCAAAATPSAEFS